MFIIEDILFILIFLMLGCSLYIQLKLIKQNKTLKAMVNTQTIAHLNSLLDKILADVKEIKTALNISTPNTVR